MKIIESFIYWLLTLSSCKQSMISLWCFLLEVFVNCRENTYLVVVVTLLCSSLIESSSSICGVFIHHCQVVGLGICLAYIEESFLKRSDGRCWIGVCMIWMVWGHFMCAFIFMNFRSLVLHVWFCASQDAALTWLFNQLSNLSTKGVLGIFVNGRYIVCKNISTLGIMLLYMFFI